MSDFTVVRDGDVCNVVITKERYDELVENEKFLYALQGAGVDNWDGYEYAQEAMDD